MTHVQPRPTIRMLSLVSSFRIPQSLLWSEGEMHWNVFHVQEFITLCDLTPWMARGQDDNDRINNFLWTNKDGRMSRFASQGTKFKTALEALTTIRAETAEMSSGGWPQTSANPMAVISFPLEKVTLKVSTSKYFSSRCGWRTHPGCLSAPTTETESFASLWHCGKWCV